ncbi:unnamed protein product [Blepharisma stoltei]|uniref:Uncharacterized protein n=1 Tax=Blepharisma stoltei TaxID=1481888 RepID=A0AAU9JBQ1_9CILI|nr:unnamed protein product [Blepharisma stoltei]
MGCGNSRRIFRIKNCQDEGDTSFHDLRINISPPQMEQSPELYGADQYAYEVNGTAYKITVAMIKTPDGSQVIC